jgi:hypothetical protein
MKDGLPIKLIYRMATIEDVRAVDAPRVTRALWKAGSGPQGGVSKVGYGHRNKLTNKSHAFTHLPVSECIFHCLFTAP